MTQRPTVLAIGGTDPTGLAGLSTDIRTIDALGAHPASVVTATTAQNNSGVSAIAPVPDSHLRAQLEAVDKHSIGAVKTGLFARVSQISIVADFIRQTRLPLVLDPVLSSSSGTAFLGEGGQHALRETLLPLANVVTPNLPEAQALTGSDSDDLSTLAAYLRCRDQQHVVVKGGHVHAEQASDFYSGPTETFLLSSARRDTPNTRGTGCLFASALASAMARGERIEDAVVIAKMAVNQGLRSGYSPLPGQPGVPRVGHWPAHAADLPALLPHGTPLPDGEAFADCGDTPLGLYPIVDRADWLAQLLPLGISTIQLRIKDLSGAALDREIGLAVQTARRFKARLFINDDWRGALRHGAYGVHLGQEDLQEADLKALRQAGLRLGISTHCHAEVARAVALRPSYIACGPVYPTQTKQMPWQTLGPERLAYWRALLAPTPVVAIAGINPDNITAVSATGVSGIAVISAITAADDPAAAAQTLMQAMTRQRSAGR